MNNQNVNSNSIKQEPAQASSGAVGEAGAQSFSTTSYGSLKLICLDPERHALTSNYWYIIESRGMPHTAFTSRNALLRWLKRCGLSLNNSLPNERGVFAYIAIAGMYRTASHLSYTPFYALKGFRCRKLSNGRFTLAITTADTDGIRTVHTLNPNCHDRPEYDYAESLVMCL